MDTFISGYPVVACSCLINDVIKDKRAFSQEYLSIITCGKEFIQNVNNLTFDFFLWLRIVLPSDNKQLVSLFL